MLSNYVYTVTCVIGMRCFRRPPPHLSCLLEIYLEAQTLPSTMYPTSLPPAGRVVWMLEPNATYSASRLHVCMCTYACTRTVYESTTKLRP